MDLLKSIGHPDEIVALLKYKINSKQSHEGSRSDTMERCYGYLNATSRSFAFIIQQLDSEIRDVVCIYYLVLRALDTVEDDMTIDDVTKIPMLTSFHQNLYDASWNFEESHENDKIVLENFTDISSEFRALKPMYRDIISSTCRKMGHGMALFTHKPIKSFDDWNLYCHYVAGLVGLGLSDIFSASGLESAGVAEDKNSANSMGLFLQKTNIIRDFLEDSEQARYFWPEEVWTKLKVKRPTGAAANPRQALPCLNHLITDALNHVGDVIKYLERVSNPSVFSFCAVPQIMAIATLEKCYNNDQVLKGCVKIRRGESLSLMAQATSLESVKEIFRKYILKIKYKIPASDPSAMATFFTIEKALNLTRNNDTKSVGEVASLKNAYYPLYLSLALLVAAIFWNYWLKHFGASGL